MNSIINFFKSLFQSKPKSDSKIITAKVTKIEKHPNADRLRVIGLSDGTQDIYPVVCGAFNFSEGAIVALALPGAVIPKNIHSENHESFALSTAKIRGIESQGMICSDFELGLSETIGEGIMLFPDNAPLGQPVLK